MANYVAPDGTVKVKIIAPGQGSSAYYEKAQLERDAHVFEFDGKNGLVFINHPSRSERRDRPERDLRDLAGAITGAPAYEERGEDGPGIYGKVSVVPHWREFVNATAPFSGMSIRASGGIVQKEISGRQTNVAEKFTGGGVDFVTSAGAGGKVLPLYEAAHNAAGGVVGGWMKDYEFSEDDERSDEQRFIEWIGNKEGQMDLIEAQKQIDTLTEEKEGLVEKNKKLAEALALRDARDKITEAVNDKKLNLPDVTKERLVESLTKSAPMKDGELDEAALMAAVSEAVKAEQEYLKGLASKKGITGMGESAGGDDGKKELYERKVADYMRQGRTEEVAKRLAAAFAEGR